MTYPDLSNLTRSHVIALIAILVSAGVICAQDGLEDEPEVGVAERGQRILIARNYLDNMVFGGKRDAAAAKKWLEIHLALRIDEIDRVCPLSDEQKSRLTLAGHGDMKRFEESVNALRKTFEADMADETKIEDIPQRRALVPNILIDRNKFSEIQPKIDALNVQFQQGIFGERSIFTKNVNHTLSAEQSARYQAKQKDAAELRHRSMVKLFVAAMEHTVAMTADQRSHLTELLQAVPSPRNASKSYDLQFMSYQLAKIPEPQLRLIFTDFQWPKVQQLRSKSLLYETILRTHGYLPLEDKPERSGDGEID